MTARRKPGPMSADEQAAGGYRWAVHLTGDFDVPNRVFVSPCRSLEVAQRRAVWWRRWRRDVAVVVCRREGREWVPVEVDAIGGVL